MPFYRDCLLVPESAPEPDCSTVGTRQDKPVQFGNRDRIGSEMRGEERKGSMGKEKGRQGKAKGHFYSKLNISFNSIRSIQLAIQ